MKLLVPYVFVCLSLNAASSECTKMEFAELQSMSRAELDSLYCESLRDAYSERQLADFYRESSRRHGSDVRAMRKAEQANKSMALCLDESLRALKVVVKKRGKKDYMPDCAKVLPNWQKEWDWTNGGPKAQ